MWGGDSFRFANPPRPIGEPKLGVTPPAHPVPARAAKWPKIPPTWHQNGSNMEPKWSQLGTKMEQNGAKMGQNFEKNRFKKATQQKTGRRLTAPPLLSRKSGQHGSKLASQIEKKKKKIDAKIDQKFDASWDRFLGGFWWILEGKMEASGDQHRLKIDADC